MHLILIQVPFCVRIPPNIFPTVQIERSGFTKSLHQSFLYYCINNMFSQKIFCFTPILLPGTHTHCSPHASMSVDQCFFENIQTIQTTHYQQTWPRIKYYAPTVDSIFRANPTTIHLLCLYIVHHLPNPPIRFALLLRLLASANSADSMFTPPIYLLFVQRSMHTSPSIQPSKTHQPLPTANLLLLPPCLFNRTSYA